MRAPSTRREEGTHASAPHKLVQLVLGTAKKEMKMLVQQVPTNSLGQSEGKARVEDNFRKDQEEESVSFSLLATMPKVDKTEDEQAMLREGNETHGNQI